MAKVFSGITHTADTYAVGNDGRIVDSTQTGQLRSRLLFDEELYEIQIRWDRITLANKNSILTDYDTNKDVEFEVDISDSAGNLTTYENLHWVAKPNFAPSDKTGGRWSGGCTIHGNLQ